MAFFVLQMAYCILVVGIPIGSIAERSTVTFVVIMSMATSMLIYPVLVHMIWSEEGMFSAYRDGQFENGEDQNLLFDCGVIDFAGSGVLHLCGGLVALAAALIVGARKNRWKTADDSVKPVIQPKPQSSPAVRQPRLSSEGVRKQRATLHKVKGSAVTGCAARWLES